MNLRWHKTTTKVYGDRSSKNEDVFLHVKRRGEDIDRFVMCDGATSSYAARVWAELLMKSFAQCGDLSDRDRIYAAVRDYEALYPPMAMAGMDHCSIEAFKRGSSATLLLIVQDKDNRKMLHITAVGDTCCFVIDKEFRVLKSFPLENVQDFSTSTYLLTVTFEGIKQLFAENTRGRYWKKICLDMGEYPGAKLVCATDAVSQWIVANRKCPERISQLITAVRGSRKHGRFVRFIECERGLNAMPVDDSSVAVLEI